MIIHFVFIACFVSLILTYAPCTRWKYAEIKFCSYWSTPNPSIKKNSIMKWSILLSHSYSKFVMHINFFNWIWKLLVENIFIIFPLFWSEMFCIGVLLIYTQFWLIVLSHFVHFNSFAYFLNECQSKMNRYFYFLSFSFAVSQVNANCSHCCCLKVGMWTC